MRSRHPHGAGRPHRKGRGWPRCRGRSSIAEGFFPGSGRARSRRSFNPDRNRPLTASARRLRSSRSVGASNVSIASTLETMSSGTVWPLRAAIFLSAWACSSLSSICMTIGKSFQCEYTTLLLARFLLRSSTPSCLILIGGPFHLSLDLKSLIDKLSPLCRRSLEAAGLCVSRTHYNVEIEHLLAKLLALPDGQDTDLRRALREYGLDRSLLSPRWRRPSAGSTRATPARRRSRRRSCNSSARRGSRPRSSSAARRCAPARCCSPCSTTTRSAGWSCSPCRRWARSPATSCGRTPASCSAARSRTWGSGRRRRRPRSSPVALGSFRAAVSSRGRGGRGGAFADALARPVHHQPDRSAPGRARSTRSSAATPRSAR